MKTEDIKRIITAKIKEIEDNTPKNTYVEHNSRSILKLCGAPDDVRQRYLIICGRILRLRGWERRKHHLGDRLTYWIFQNPADRSLWR